MPMERLSSSECQDNGCLIVWYIGGCEAPTVVGRGEYARLFDRCHGLSAEPPQRRSGEVEVASRLCNVLEKEFGYGEKFKYKGDQT